MDLMQTPPPALSARASGDVQMKEAKSGNPPSGLSSDYQTFLRMLTVQMQNQDPFNPMDATELAQQLASFSSVEQQVLTNSLLEGLSSKITLSSLGQISSWLGKEVQITGPVHHSGQPVEIYAQPDPLAESAYLVVSDADGEEVARMALDSANESVIWNGKDSSGSSVADGIYQFHINNLKDGEPLKDGEAAVFVSVNEVAMRGNTPTLVLQGGIEVAADAVRAVRHSTAPLTSASTDFASGLY